MIASYTPIAASALTAGANPTLTLGVPSVLILSTPTALTLSLSKGEGGQDGSAHSSSFVVRQDHHEALGMRNEVVIAGGER
jgi:hypothetical protein